jgi:hypothetical protein
MSAYVPEPGRNRTGRRQLTPQQQVLAEDLHMRAAALRAAADDGMSIREAIDLAAVQLGLEAPDFSNDESGDE